jgi:hypothetical protein
MEQRRQRENVQSALLIDGPVDLDVCAARATGCPGAPSRKVLYSTSPKRHVGPTQKGVRHPAWRTRAGAGTVVVVAVEKAQ